MSDWAGEAIDVTGSQVEVARYVKAFAAGSQLRAAGAAADPSADADPDAPVVKVVDLLIEWALRERASDVHLEPQEHQVRVRFRIDGVLRHVQALPLSMRAAVVGRIKVLAEMDIVERRRSQGGQFATEIDGREVDVRVSTTATLWGEKVVLRLLDKSRRLKRLHELGMPADSAAVYSRIVHSPFGMVLCAGPTGSGKTTTLYATIAELDDEARNIMTIEDPVEYVVDTVNQIQISEHAGLTFADGLKSILRQDPDVILVGEIRDVETARIAVQSALTGHMVLSCVHAIDTAAALHRFLDMGIELFLVTSSVLAVVAQRLLRRVCEQCKTFAAVSQGQYDFYLSNGGRGRDTFAIGEGCERCGGTGYFDRIGAYELLRLTPEIKKLLVGGATQDQLRDTAVTQGMRTLTQEAIQLVDLEITTVSEVLRGMAVV